MKSGADGILYDSTRQSPGVCLALFDTPAALRALGAFRKVGSSYENPAVMAHLTAEKLPSLACDHPQAGLAILAGILCSALAWRDAAV